ncbi:Sorbitol-6-phosphate 2-dehydrogenase [hydrothermal vent metagenome]|uniref:Sorbitol-6-phosphate 2-dehydrogenase n=1 Tax=hydrothermal vent metagenome TaxID=652676 RepID=A0A1W1B948_9ZZZZ
MTEDIDLPEKLTVQPDKIAQDIFNAQQNGKKILYTKLGLEMCSVDY